MGFKNADEYPDFVPLSDYLGLKNADEYPDFEPPVVVLEDEDDAFGNVYRDAEFTNLLGRLFDDGEPAKFVGLEGDDIILGGNGLDFAAYDESPEGVFADLSLGLALDGYGNTDLLSQIEALWGSAFDDTLIGDAAENILFGDDGDDDLMGFGGTDFLVGGEGHDYAHYFSDASGVLVNLDVGAALDGSNYYDLLIEIESAVGSLFGDFLFGNDGNNHLDGFLGDDVLYGAGGNDRLDGGRGDDTLISGTGSDVMLGGLGSDLFVLTAEHGSHVQILDFEVGVDRLDLRGLSYSRAAEAFSATATNGAILTFTNGAVVHVEGADVTSEVLFSRGVLLRPLGEVVFGGLAGEALHGGLGDDIITGQSGDDTLIGAFGDDDLIGGAGNDTAVFSGNQNSFSLTLSAADMTMTDRRDGGEGADRLFNIELALFDDTIDPFNLSIFGGTAGLEADVFELFIELYIAYFNRAPDAIGLNFWGTAFANGTSLEEMARLFATQPETLAAYPEDSSNLVFATTVYNNVLGRTPDEEGIQFWVGLLDEGLIGRDGFILDVLKGAKSELKPELGQDFVDQQLADRQYLETKTDLGAYFAVHKGMSNIDNASASMGHYDGTELGLLNAVNAIDTFYAEANDASSGEFIMTVVGVLDPPAWELQ